ncbi:MAG: nitrate reductase cytochrome c-type subunit [Myxococcota bacterium]|nr:nitrate reductase cytochrome c-type subunit [Myxococcota bacterium]
MAIRFRVMVVAALALVIASGGVGLGCLEAPSDALALADGRAYSGAPPTIPHQVEQLGRGECLQCHLKGDAVDKEGRQAKRTPHPELEHCQQCHVAQRANDIFRKNEFKGSTYRIGLRSQPEGPWLIPHPLTMRENCLGCHGDPQAPEQLRTDHPEREHCLQCHIPAHEGFPRARSGL